jgi:hypothetical protein
MIKFLFPFLILLFISACVPAKEPLDASPLNGVWKGSTQCLIEMEYVMRIDGKASGEIIAEISIDFINDGTLKNVPERTDMGTRIYKGRYYEDSTFEIKQEPMTVSSNNPQAESMVDLLNKNRQILKGKLSENGMELNLEQPGPACEPFTAIKIG